MKHPQIRAWRPGESADISFWLYYGVGKGRDKGMDGGVNRSKVMEHPAGHIQKLAPKGHCGVTEGSMVQDSF